MEKEAKKSIMTNILPEILKHEDLCENYKIDNFKNIELSNMSGDNNFMISSLFICTILFNDDKKLSLVVKILDQDLTVQQTFGMDKMFANEIAAYKIVVERLNLQKLFPRCYYFCEDCPQIIVMEDIRLNGYRMADSMTWLSKEHITLAVKKLGFFHGRCYALKENNFEEFERICSLFDECRYLDSDMNFTSIFNICAQRGLRGLELEVNGDNNMKKFIEDMKAIFANSLDYARSLIKSTSPLSVLCHGDYLRNNVMYSYDEDNEPKDIMLLDLQTFRYASPATDLSLFLFMHYEADKLIEDWDFFFSEYHNALITELSTAMKKSISDLPSYYSATNLGRDFAQFCLHGFFTASYFMGCMHDPITEDPREFFFNATPEEVERDTMTRGGETVTNALVKILKFVKYIQAKYDYQNF